MTILEKIEFEEDWLSEVNLTKENVKIALEGIRATVREQQPCEDCISRQAVLDGLASIAKAKAKSDAQKSLIGRVMFFTEQLPSVTPKITDVENNYNIGYNCGYADAMFDISESEDNSDEQ